MSKKGISQVDKSKRVNGNNFNKMINDFMISTNSKGKVTKNKIIVNIKTKEGKKIFLLRIFLILLVTFGGLSYKYL